jgi:ethylbenzene hydroxylase subunit beta/complex iron-sulfur molybdoenzyme family reductase subunit beta
MDVSEVGRAREGKVIEPARQLAMVFDLNKCLGCQTCTLACKTLWTGNEGMEWMWWTVVNTMPGRGTPRDWDESGGGFDEAGLPRPGRLPRKEEFGEAWEFNYDEVFHGGKGQSVHLGPKQEPGWGPNWDEDQGAGEYPNAYYFYLPRICNHCTHPACLESCPRKAIYKREEDGIVLINEDRCKGYRFCMEACPYKRIYFNFTRQVAQKCIFCFPRLEKGVAPACARQCPGRLRFVGYLDDPAGPIHKLVKEWKVALPLHPEFGTDPNVYYVPPLAPPRIDAKGGVEGSGPRIPMAYLRGLFGSGVDDALATLQSEMARRRRGEMSELMELLIVYRWPEHIFPDFPEDPARL